ncbi:MAG: ATP-binding protein [Firmicutes bacterium]|nr:ATP-binding protein [Bacillota bacterium]MDY5855444.1 ATP-binding protein [Anaerovoracaceae bacterium]
MDQVTIEKESVLKQFDKAMEEYKRYYQCEEITGIERKTKEFIPEAAFREAVANALAHRNWDMNSHVRISLFKDRIEIKSPGGLPKGITEEEYLSGEISCLRNPVLGNVFFRMRYIEMFGTGFSKAKTIRLLNSLVEKGYVECRGNGRGTEYCLS